MRPQIADSHLTYSAVNARDHYDVYRLDGHVHIGDVYRRLIDGTWVARRLAGATAKTAETASARTRWEAATTLWPA